MKKLSVKMAILIPALLILVAGIIAMIITVSAFSSSTTNDLTGRLMSARVNESSNRFEALCMDSYGKATALAPIVDNLSALENGRAETIDVLTDVLRSDENMLGIWTCWEPDAFDGNDRKYAGTANHDETGRFVPYIYKSSSGVGYEALQGYETPGDGDYYLGARNSGKPYITDPYEYVVDGQTTQLYSIAAPIKRNGTVVGVVGIDIKLENIISMMNSISILDDGYVITVSPSGMFATHSNSDLLLKDYKTVWLKTISSDIDRILTSGGDISVTAYSDVINANIRFLGSGVMIGDTGRYWVVGGIVPEKTASASSITLLWLIIGIGLALIVVVGVAIYVLVNGRLRELPVMTVAAEAIAKGDINLAGLDAGTEHTKNEITLLGRAFASMANGIKKQADVMEQISQGDYSMAVQIRCDADVMNKAINGVLDRTNQTMAEIQTSTVQVSAGSKQIADGAQALAQGSTQQAAAVEQLSSSIHEIADKTKENADMAVRAADLGNIIKGNAEKGSKQMGEMMQAVKEINDASQSINKVIKVIDDIAFQTNILALNAAVEAARAGQHGKGFAVVAEEVRNLAAKSAEAAKDTSSLIANSIEKAELGSQIAGETAESLAEIVAGINESSQIVGDIARSSEEQSEGITQINKGIEQVAQVVQQNSATAEESAAASEEMSGQSDILEDLISQFKLRSGGNTSRSLPSAKASPKRLEMPEKSYDNDYGKY